MQTRHRIPSIFNLSMVDVLCCALGCVLLLWLLNLREARDRAAEASQTTEERDTARDERDTARREWDAAQKELDAVRKELALARGELNDLMLAASSLGADLDKARQQAAANRQHFLDADKLARSTALLLEKTRSERDAARNSMTDLEKKLAAAGRRAEDLTGRISDTEGRLKQLQATADLVPGLRDEVKSYRDKFLAEQSQAQTLEKSIKQRLQELAAVGKELTEVKTARQALEMSIAARDRDLAQVNRDLIALQGEKKSLLGEITRVKAAAENRFAGINLTGRRVVFLIDKSGSMGLIDPDTPDKEKWPTVCRTVAQIMRSLPDLEKFQVVVFSTDASYLLGQDGRWLDYDAATSAERVQKALMASEPKGGTNLHSGFEAVFRPRITDMDTIYLISDGIPDRGAGLPANADKLSPVERSALLSKHIRQTLKYDWNRPRAGQARVRINCVGFFYESPDLGAFLWALARENDGSFVGMSKP